MPNSRFGCLRRRIPQESRQDSPISKRVQGEVQYMAIPATQMRPGMIIKHNNDLHLVITVDEIPMELLYQDGDSYCFMNTENYEQTHLSKDTLGDSVDYLTPNLQIKVEFYDGKPVGIELPQTVELTVVETEPGLKSATASSVTKAAKTETGLVVQVPPFINEGEKIRVDTAEGVYLSRA